MITISNTLKPDFTPEEVRTICDKFQAGHIVDGEKIFDTSDYEPLTGANLNGLRGKRFRFMMMYFRNASFRQSIIEGSNFSFTTIHFCDFFMSDLHGAQLYRADVHKTNFRWASMKCANMTQIHDFGSDYTRADLKFAILKYATLINVNFSYADLRGVDFSGAGLYSVDFRGAALEGAKFEDATIKNCIFDNDQKQHLKGATLK